MAIGDPQEHHMSQLKTRDNTEGYTHKNQLEATGRAQGQQPPRSKGEGSQIMLHEKGAS